MGFPLPCQLSEVGPTCVVGVGGVLPAACRRFAAKTPTNHTCLGNSNSPLFSTLTLYLRAQNQKNVSNPALICPPDG
jgi:hypothetical protein